jgi:site-specific DNA recombinase
LAGRLFNEQGHRMTSTHTNKDGVRYSYYVSQALLRKQAHGPIGRVSAPELESAVVEAIRRHLQGDGSDLKPIPEANRELIEQYLLRATLNAKEITLHLRGDSAPTAGQGDPLFAAGNVGPITIAIPWIAPAATPAKGIVHVPSHNTPMKPGRREVLLTAIAKARRWLKDVEVPTSPGGKARPNGMSAIWHRSPSYRRASSRRSWTAPPRPGSL